MENQKKKKKKRKKEKKKELYLLMKAPNALSLSILLDHIRF